MIINELNNEKRKNILKEFYETFDNGYEFEDFLKPFLEKIGLDEVKVTKRSNDGGIDLECVRYGVIDTNGDSVKYKVQAKRFNPNSSISVDIVDRHRGIMKNGERGIIITTAKFSEPAIKSAASETERPILLIDGASLIDICIEKNIGFVYDPIFDINELKRFYKNDLKTANIDINDVGINMLVSNIEKDITANDIRARIISIPRTILDELPIDKDTFDIVFNENEIKNVKISTDRRYFSKGFSEMYRKYSLLGENGEFYPRKSLWSYDGNKIYINLIK
ncbi:MAG: restriction endonuclease [Bacilli bacterium]